jgi:hypothetical protein
MKKRKPSCKTCYKENSTPPRLTTLKGHKQHWGRRLDEFRVAYGLSERDLVAVIDPAAKLLGCLFWSSEQTARGVQAARLPGISLHRGIIW